MPTVNTFRDFFLKGNTQVEIVCAVKGAVVRRLTLDGSTVTIDPMQGPTVDIEVSTPITYEPWIFDRGSLLFDCEITAPEPAKLCTELDLVRYPDGHEEQVNHPGAKR
jgi:hypothetical protein